MGPYGAFGARRTFGEFGKSKSFVGPRTELRLDRIGKTP